MQVRRRALQDVEPAGVGALERLSAVDQACLVLERESEDGSHFVDVESARADSRTICEALVVDEGPSFAELVG